MTVTAKQRVVLAALRDAQHEQHGQAVSARQIAAVCPAPWHDPPDLVTQALWLLQAHGLVLRLSEISYNLGVVVKVGVTETDVEETGSDAPTKVVEGLTSPISRTTGRWSLPRPDASDHPFCPRRGHPVAGGASHRREPSPIAAFG